MLFVGNSYGQKVPYEKLEAFSKEISQLQFEANGQTYNDGTTDYEISFPEENFTVAFNNQLATNVVYKKTNNKELMYLTENISLGRVFGFTSEVMDDIVVWKINFGKFTVTTQVFQDGKLIDTTTKNEMILYSYINTNRKATDPTFFKSFSELCNTMKKSIGLITDKELESENKDWEDKKNTMADFVKKHPNSVRTMQGKNIIANKEKAKEREYIIASEFIDSLCIAHKFKIGLNEKEFINYNLESANIIKLTRRTRVNNNSIMYCRQNTRMGINNIIFTNDIVTRYKLMVIEDKKGKSNCDLYFSNLFNNVKKNISKEYYRYYINKDKSYQTIDINIPNEKLKIEISFHTLGGTPGFSEISFDFIVVE